MSAATKLELTNETSSEELQAIINAVNRAQAIHQVAESTEKSAIVSDAIAHATTELAKGADLLKETVQKFSH